MASVLKDRWGESLLLCTAVHIQQLFLSMRPDKLTSQRAHFAVLILAPTWLLRQLARIGVFRVGPQPIAYCFSLLCHSDIWEQ